MIIVQISDTHLDPDNPEAEVRIRDLERVVADINGLETPPNAVIHTGDLTHNGTPAKYDLARSILNNLKAPIHFSAGNRDDRQALPAAFPITGRLMPDTPFVQYAIDDYPVRLIALDTISAETNMGDFCDARAESLRRALADQPDKPTVLFMHHPPFDVVTSKYRWQFDDQDGIERMRQALAGQTQVLRGFCGHAHRDATGTLGHVPFSSIPSVAIDLRLGDFADDAQSSPVYQIHRYDADKGFTSELRSAA